VAVYSYKAKTASGETAAGKLDAVDRDTVVDLLRSRGLLPMEISEVSVLDREIKLKKNRAIALGDISLFCKQFYTMINSGVTIIGSLDLLRKQTENAHLAKILTRMYEDVQKGVSLSDSMKQDKDAFPAIVISMIEIGEISGSLDTVLDRLSVYIEKENRVKQKIKTAMVYPKVLSVIAIVVIAFMMTFIVPNFVAMFKNIGGQLPLPTRILLWISNLFKNPWFLASLAIIIPASVYSFRKFKKSDKGRYFISWISLKLPVIGKNTRKLIASRFSRSLGLLLRTGVSLIQSLEVVENVLGNVIVSKALEKVKEDIKRGSGLAEPLEGIGIFPLMVNDMISIGEEAGSLDSIVEKVADFYDDELDASISKMVTMLEPLMIVVIALMVGGIVIAMILPVFSMYKGLR